MGPSSSPKVGRRLLKQVRKPRLKSMAFRGRSRSQGARPRRSPASGPTPGARLLLWRTRAPGRSLQGLAVGLGVWRSWILAASAQRPLSISSLRPPGSRLVACLVCLRATISMAIASRTTMIQLSIYAAARCDRPQLSASVARSRDVRPYSFFLGNHSSFHCTVQDFVHISYSHHLNDVNEGSDTAQRNAAEALRATLIEGAQQA